MIKILIWMIFVYNCQRVRTCSPIQQTNAECTSLDLTDQVNSPNSNYMSLQIIKDGHDKKKYIVISIFTEDNWPAGKGFNWSNKNEQVLGIRAEQG